MKRTLHAMKITASVALLRPQRGISQNKLLLHLGFQFVNNARQRGKALLSALLGATVA